MNSSQILAHELRNPLAPIRKHARTSENAGSNARIFTINRSGGETNYTMKRLLDDLLDVLALSKKIQTTEKI